MIFGKEPFFLWTNIRYKFQIASFKRNLVQRLSLKKIISDSPIALNPSLLYISKIK